MTIVSVDLDDTLLLTSQDYEKAEEDFSIFMENRFGIDAETVKQKRTEIDYELLQKYGLKKERHKQIYINTLYEFIDNPSAADVVKAKSFGKQIFKTADEYASRGFMNGAEIMLNCLRENTDELHLVTVGDPNVQKPKIEGLNLTKWFDSIHIPSYETGKKEIFAELLDECHYTQDNFIHIGNSASSDVEAAISVGGYAVYISTDVDWLSNEELHKQVINHKNVYVYNSATEFIPEIPTVLQNHTHLSNLNNRII